MLVFDQVKEVECDELEDVHCSQKLVVDGDGEVQKGVFGVECLNEVVVGDVVEDREVQTH